MRKYITFACGGGGIKCEDCPYINSTQDDCLLYYNDHPLICDNEDCNKCEYKFKCFTTDNDEPIVVTAQKYKLLRRKWKRFPLETSLSFNEDGEIR